MGVYDRQIAQAQRKIQAKGERCTWTKHNAVSADASKPWNTSSGGTPTTYLVYVVFLTPDTKFGDLVQLLKGSSVPMGAPRGLMAQVPFTPEINDSVTRKSGVVVVIRGFDIINPNGEVILYKLDFA